MSTSFTPSLAVRARGASEAVYHPNEEEKALIESGVREFLVGKATWADAYFDFLSKYYAAGFKEKCGERILILREPGKRPSYDQFIYHGRRRVSLADRLTLRYGEHARRRKNESFAEYMRRMAPHRLPGSVKWALFRSRSMASGETVASKRVRQLEAVNDSTAFKPGIPIT